MRTQSTRILGLALSLLASSIYATEIDSFTDRDPTLRDATDAINRRMNNYLTAASNEADQEKSCDHRVIEKALLKQFGGDLWSKIENDIMSDLDIDRRQSTFAESVYRDFSIMEAFALYMAKLGPLMRFGDLYVGTDKLGHFIQQGYYMYKDLYAKGYTFQDTINWSKYTEDSYYGSMTTGVYSYGDLAANYDGLYFWERITNTRLPPNVKPYFECKDNVWWRVASFDIRNYLNAAWDEGINCNTYKTEAMEEKVIARIAELEANSGRSLQCPIAPEQCSVMIERYGNVAPYLITPKCF